MNTKISFGRYIIVARKKKNLTQRELAKLIKKENGESISAPYLNDIEHDRRQPTSDHILNAFAKALEIDVDVLLFKAGRIPEEVRMASADEKKISEYYKKMRKYFAST